MPENRCAQIVTALLFSSHFENTQPKTQDGNFFEDSFNLGVQKSIIQNLKAAICPKTAVCIELELRFRGCLAK